MIPLIYFLKKPQKNVSNKNFIPSIDQSLHPPHWLWLILCRNYFIWYTPSRACTSNLSHPIHWLVDNTVQIIFVLFLSIGLNWFWCVCCYGVNFLYPLFQVINHHWFLYSLLLDSLQFQRWDCFADYFCFSVNSNEFFVLDFVEMVSLC